MSEKKSFHLRLDAELFEKIKEKAKKEGRSVTNYIVTTIKKKVG